MRIIRFVGLLVLAYLPIGAAELGCSAEADTPGIDLGSSTGGGGSNGSTTKSDRGGTPWAGANGTDPSDGIGGTRDNRGNASTGGRAATGSGTNTGGSSGSGRDTGAGGASGTPGSNQADAAGGSAKTGGTTGRGGGFVVDRGRATGTGGSRAAGGAMGTGGSKDIGGATATGGAKGTGGAAAIGGAMGTGGATGTGGTTKPGGSTGPVAVSCPGAVPQGITSSWCSCDQWGQWSNGNATFYNNIWGSGAGSQCIWATTSNSWGVAANHPNTGGIKSYADISFSPGKAISAISSYSSSFDVTVPSGGSWETAYDVWVKNGNRIEIMLWMNKNGAVGPIASKYDSSGNAVPDVSEVAVGGHTWNVFYGSNGSNDVVSLIRTANTNKGSVDIKAILNWIISNKGSFNTSWTLDQVQFGFEITSNGSAQSFVVNSFSVSSS